MAKTMVSREDGDMDTVRNRRIPSGTKLSQSVDAAISSEGIFLGARAFSDMVGHVKFMQDSHFSELVLTFSR